MVDLLAEYLEHIEKKPVFPDVEPAMLTQLFAEPLPQDASSPESVLASWKKSFFRIAPRSGTLVTWG